MLKWMAVLVGLAVAAPAAAAPAAAAPVAWVELTPQGAEARAIVDGAGCPTLRADGKAIAMRTRAAPGEAFPNRVCAARLPRRARRLVVAGSALRAPIARPNRLVIFGDSGCRIVKGLVQNCNDPVAGWPFAQVARLAAAQHPDLVIHLGDYYYREAPCPPATEACAGSPYGDRWATWKAELFDPARPLLAAAPWVFVRGNHEDCARGGAGWFRLVDPLPPLIKGTACATSEETWFAPIGGIRLAIFDDAEADDNKSDPGAEASASKGILPVLDSREPTTWLVTHRPLWALSHKGLSIGGDWGNVNVREAVKAWFATPGVDVSWSHVSLMLAGHVHNFTSLDFAGARPPELIVGTGGDVQDPRDPHRPLQLSLPVDGVTANAITTGEFGYFVFDRIGADWVGAFHDLDDQVTIRCRLHAARLACVPVAPKS
ncbi:metallophosphoesterase [Phenylobacterium sp.]|uniref:metallophosphoesterase family protein n=1 Tax=Phenylobacterium sp. TaxID=1871053 RepID=UPI00262762A1|nr:metallophosphoesterase [Phenylobacterium sp.]